MTLTELDGLAVHMNDNWEEVASALNLTEKIEGIKARHEDAVERK